MRRRTNKSAKVPNVKLRPAQPSQTGSRTNILRADESICLADESQFGSDDVHQDFTPRPFRGVVLCATGIPDKPTLFKQAVELGAVAVPAFTDRVTHLIAIDHGGAKYSCAVERKVPILQPSWITESFQIWLRGDDVDMEEMTSKHRLPIFSDIVLCPSGIPDITRRTQIHKLITEHGGQYVKNLERPVRITHLLCSGEEETDKMRYAEKFNRTGEAKPPIRLVWEEWFWDSLEFGGRFDEDKYQVRRPRPERKAVPDQSMLPIEETAPMSSSLAETSTKIPPKPHNDVDDAEETASVKVLPAVTLQLWESLLKVRGYEISPNGKLSRSPTKAREIMAHIGVEPESPTRGGQKRSVIDNFRRANSFAELPTRSSQGPRRTKTIPDLIVSKADNGKSISRRESDQSDNNAGPSSPHRVPLPPSSRSPSPEAVSTSDAADQMANQITDVEMANGEAMGRRLFSGKVFRALGEASSPSVREAIESHGGRLVGEKDPEDGEVDYVLVRLVSGSKYYHSEPLPSEQLKYRTECWLERCMFEERIIPPDENITFVPLELRQTIPGADRIVLSFSGLDQSEVCCVKRLAKALGVAVSPNFSRRSTHLLCPSGMGAKFDKAKEWGVPVVSMAWLESIAKRGSITSISGFEVNAGGTDAATTNTIKMDKGKGKAKDTGASPIIDITNSSGPDDLQLAIPDFAIPISTPSSNASSTSRFGAPNGLLRGAVTDMAKSSLNDFNMPEAPSEKTSPDKEHDNPIIQPNIHLHRSQPERPLPSPLGSGHSTPGPPSSNPDLPEERQDIPLSQLPIPSSKSPSPLKLPGNAESGRQTVPSSPSKSSPTGGPPSPTKIPVEAARALQKSITSLLGKRRESEEDQGGQAATSGATAARAKRARPQRQKGQSRQNSEIRVTATDPVTGDPFGPYNRNQRHTTDELHVLNGESQTNSEDSVRVIYEDPKQLEEKQRLMNLLGEGNKETDGEGGKAKSKPGTGSRRPTRRSTRSGL